MSTTSDPSTAGPTRTSGPTGTRPASFAPRPGSAPLSRQVLAQASMEARLMLRNGEQLLLAVVIPVIVLLGGVLGAEHLGITFSRSPSTCSPPGSWPWP